jgi:rod shape determining protein RodA
MQHGARSLKIDFGLLLSFLILTVLGILTIYSVSSGTAGGRGVEKQHVKQIYWAITGIAIFVLLLFVHYQKLGEYALIIYICSILILVITLFFGKRVRGAKSWITIIGGFGFQPSEFVKISTILMLAKYLERTGDEIKKIPHVVIALVIVLIPLGLILLQPDFGTALVYLPIGIVMLYFGGIKVAHFLSMLIILGIAVTLPLLTTFSTLVQSSSLAFLQMLNDPKAILIIAIMFGILSVVSFILYKFFRKDFIGKSTKIFLIFFSGLILSAFFSRLLKPYQKERLIVFLKPAIDPYGAG